MKNFVIMLILLLDKNLYFIQEIDPIFISLYLLDYARGKVYLFLRKIIYDLYINTIKIKEKFGK